MSRNYISPVIILLFSFIIISFFWIAVPYANAGGNGAGNPCDDSSCQSEEDCTDEEDCCEGGNCPGNCFWDGRNCLDDPPEGACCFSDQCSIKTEDACEGERQVYQGDGSQCLQDTCLPIGCCGDSSTPDPPGNCFLTSDASSCRGAGVSFLEDGVCDANNNCNLEANPDHLMCYKVKDPLIFERGKTIFISVPQFGSEARCKIKGRTREFCAPACKAEEGGPPVGADLCQPDSESPLAFDRVCYNIEQCTNISGQIDGLEAGVTDQFDDDSKRTEGPRLFTNFNPHQLCTPALKCHPDCSADTFIPGDLCTPDGITVSGADICDLQCQCVPVVCGDGIVGPGEDCDPPDGESEQCGNDECSQSCQCLIETG